MQQNWLDKAISWVSPATGAQRIRSRVAADLLLSYEAVRSVRRMGGWNPTGFSGNAEIGPAMTKLRDNARDLVRNNAYAKKAVREWSKRVVGYGITPQADTGNDKLNAIIDAYWLKWAPLCSSDRRKNFYGEQKTIVRAAFETGECLVRMWTRTMDDGLPVPFQIQVLEADYLDRSRTEQLPNGYIIHGVEFDPIGRIRGYWLFGQHPGDVVQTSARGLTSKMVPAEYVLWHGELERPGDVRAITRFAPVMNKLRDIDEYADLEIFRKKTEACLAINVTTPEGPDGPTLGAKLTDANGNTVEQLQPGMITYSSPGQGIEFMAPAASGDFAAHKKCELREVATGLGIPYVLLADDLSDVNYSSYRGGAVSFREDVDEYRWNWLIPQVLDPIWVKFIDTLAMMGTCPPGSYGVKWNPPPFDLLDRKAEAEADELELRIGKTSYPQMCGNQGLDPRKHLATITEYVPLLEKANVTFNQNTGLQNGNNQTPPSVS